MAAPPQVDDVLRQALAGLRNDDVQLFLEYFEDLKRHVCRHLSGKARCNPGSSAIAQSALLSMICDLAVQKIPIAGVDEFGQPALWPLLVRYVERHCDKWNKYYLAKKRKCGEVSLQSLGKPRDFDQTVFELPAKRMARDDERELAEACDAVCQSFTDEEREVFECWLADQSLKETAHILQSRGRRCGLSKVSYLRERIREKLRAFDPRTMP